MHSFTTGDLVVWVKEPPGHLGSHWNPNLERWKKLNGPGPFRVTKVSQGSRALHDTLQINGGSLLNSHSIAVSYATTNDLGWSEVWFVKYTPPEPLTLDSFIRLLLSEL